jgi:hypothetical protein
MFLEKEKQLHVSALRPSSGWILGLKGKYLLHRLPFTLTLKSHNWDVNTKHTHTQLEVTTFWE